MLKLNKRFDQLREQNLVALRLEDFLEENQINEL